MKEKNFNDALKAAFPAPEERPSLTTLIDRQIEGLAKRNAVRRRVLVSALATAGAIAVITLYPSVQAQATLNRMANALDGISALRMTNTNIDDSGHRFPAGETDLLGNKVRITNGAGKTEFLFLGEKSYVVDPGIGAYVTGSDSPFGRTGKSIKLSSFIAGEGGYSVSKSVQVDHVLWRGKDVLHATVENSGLPERLVFFADPKTELPLEVHAEAREAGVWRLRQIMEFDYAPRFTADTFALDKKMPVLTEDQAGERVIESIVSKQLAEVPLKKGRVVVRSIDIAEDGTVFVAYQNGDRRTNSFTGNTINLTDDLGTVYTYQGEPTVGRAEDFVKHSKDGRLEVAFFVPVTPIPPTTPRTLTLSTQKFQDGELARMIQVIEAGVLKWVPNRRRPDDVATPVKLLSQNFPRTTCIDYPDFLSRIRTNFSPESMSDMEKPRLRGQYYMEKENWAEAERWFTQQLNAIKRYERLGLGLFSEDEVRTNLEKVKAHLPPRP